MISVFLADIKKLRARTGAGVADCRKALEETGGNLKKAQRLVKSWGLTAATKKAGRVTGSGLVETYIHTGGRIGAMIEVNCETDFAAKTDEFKNLAHELAMQVAAMDPGTIEELLKQDYIRDAAKTVEDLIGETIAKVGENIVVKRFMRFELGQ